MDGPVAALYAALTICEQNAAYFFPVVVSGNSSVSPKCCRTVAMIKSIRKESFGCLHTITVSVEPQAVATQVLAECASKDECQAQVKKKAAAATVDAARGTSLEGCNGLLAELSSLCTQDAGNEQGGPAGDGPLLGGNRKTNKGTGKPLIEVIESS